METKKRKTKPLAELHFHLGSSLEPAILWSIAHQQGIKLPSKEYWEFHDMITLSKPQIEWEDYHKMFHWTELIQSSPLAMERTVYEVLTGAYRKNNILLSEPLFNPIYRNRGGEQDLDQIILAAIRGMEKALMEYPQIKAGIILALDRRLDKNINEITVKKAIKYSNRGIVGIDIAGPNKEGFRYDDYSELYKMARAAGLKTTVHTGEDGTFEEMDHVLDVLELDRLNHGIRCYQSPELMEKVKSKNLTLCICPSSNLSVGFIKDIEHLHEVIRTLYDNGVKFCINTDNPIMLRTNLTKEIDILRSNNILTEEEIDQTTKWAFEASFINLRNPNENLYL